MAEENNTPEKDRGKWANQFEFILSLLGYAIGIGNVWRFPYLAYKNGGAAFLIPYCTMLFCAGLPMFFMELALGQYVSLGPAILFQKIAPIFSGLGWCMVAVSLLTCVYYNVIIAWAIFYLFASFSTELPWGHCSNDFNTHECYAEAEATTCRTQSLYYYNRSCLTVEKYCNIVGLVPHNLTYCQDPENNGISPADGAISRISPSEDYFKNRMLGVTGTSWEDMGSIRWELVGCLALAWLLVGLSIMKGISSSGKVVYFTATFPFFMLVILLIRGITLEGSYQGIEYYFLKPNVTKMMEAEVWSDAASQIFFSYGISYGVLVTLASYNKFNNNCMRDAIVISFSNSATSVFSGFAIFSILGFLANELGVEIKDVASSGSGLAFVVYPAAINLMPLPYIWSTLFFFMIILIGLDTQFTMMETVVTALCDQFKQLRLHKTLVVFVTCFGAFLLGLTMCLEGGTYMFELFNWQVAGLSLIIVSFVQVIVVQYVYGFKKFMLNIKEMDIKMPWILHMYWAATWLFITPASLAACFSFSVYYLVPVYWTDYIFPLNIQVLGWILASSSLVILPVGAIYTICNRKKFASLTQATPDYCPAHLRKELKCPKISYKEDALDNQENSSEDRPQNPQNLQNPQNQQNSQNLQNPQNQQNSQNLQNPQNQQNSQNPQSQQTKL